MNREPGQYGSKESFREPPRVATNEPQPMLAAPRADNPDNALPQVTETQPPTPRGGIYLPPRLDPLEIEQRLSSLEDHNAANRNRFDELEDQNKHNTAAITVLVDELKEADLINRMATLETAMAVQRSHGHPEQEAQHSGSRFFYNFKVKPELAWAVLTAVGTTLSVTLTDTAAVTDWRAWAVGVAAALVRAVLAALLSAGKRPVVDPPQT